MRIWVDADACPKVIKEILYRAAIRSEVEMMVVANKTLFLPSSPFIKMVLVGAGIDVADNKIVQECQPDDLVVTADIPLADLVVDKGALALNPRGSLYTKDNIKQRLSTRNLMEELRGTGMNIGGPATINLQNQKAFADELNKFLMRHMRK